ncbi:ABC transporter permease [Streptomyces sp. NPDC048590]|uniref:ABC transporter permease n=1 Tax=Streptomyces sp. NPDC048590 TaxID=3365574 RepID=UPI0037211B1F
MPTTVITPAGPATATSTHTAVLRAEFRLFLREPGNLFWILAFPAVLLTILGLIPSFREDDPALGGRRVIDLYVPITVLLGLITSAIQAMPPVLTGYRERGILRRMSATPVRPSALLTAQILLHGAASLASAVLVITVGRAAFGVPLPGHVPGYLLALVLSVVCGLAFGATICALAPTAKAATAVGTVAYLLMMFAAGVWVPVQVMPGLLRHIVEFTPLGAASQALDQAATGGWPGWAHLAVTVVWTLVLGVGATRLFRWE